MTVLSGFPVLDALGLLPIGSVVHTTHHCRSMFFDLFRWSSCPLSLEADGQTPIKLGSNVLYRYPLPVHALVLQKQKIAMATTTTYFSTDALAYFLP
jgi:hypothetical protein